MLDFGGTGIGTTHCAAGNGYGLIEAVYSVFVTRTSDQFQCIQAARKAPSLPQRLTRLDRIESRTTPSRKSAFPPILTIIAARMHVFAFALDYCQYGLSMHRKPPRLPVEVDALNRHVTRALGPSSPRGGMRKIFL